MLRNVLTSMKVGKVMDGQWREDFTGAPAELLGVERGAVDRVVGELRGGRQERRLLTEELRVGRLELNRADQHRVARVLVRREHCNCATSQQCTVLITVYPNVLLLH